MVLRQGRCVAGTIQFVAAPDGTPLWVSDVEPGSFHDLSAARLRALGAVYKAARDGLSTLSTLAYIGAGAGVHTRFRPHPTSPARATSTTEPTTGCYAACVPWANARRRTQTTLARPAARHPEPSPHRRHHPSSPHPQQHLARTSPRKPQRPSGQERGESRDAAIGLCGPRGAAPSRSRRAPDGVRGRAVGACDVRGEVGKTIRRVCPEGACQVRLSRHDPMFVDPGEQARGGVAQRVQVTSCAAPFTSYARTPLSGRHRRLIAGFPRFTLSVPNQAHNIPLLAASVHPAARHHPIGNPKCRVRRN